MRDYWVSLRYSKTGMFLRTYGKQFGLTLVTVISLVGVLAGTQLIQKRSFENSQASRNPGDAAIRTMRIVKVFYEPPGTDIVTHYNLPTLHTQTMDLVSRASAFHDGPIRNIKVEEVHPGFVINDTRSDPDGTKYGALKAMLNSSVGNLANDGKTICDVVNELNVDQVWLWVNPNLDTAPGNEFDIINPTSNYGVPSDQYTNPACNHSKSFAVMGFDMTRSVAEALHSFGHYMEYLLVGIQGHDLIVNRYEGAGYDSTVIEKGGRAGVDGTPIAGVSLSEKCGSIHIPPNVPLGTNGLYPGYQYNIETSVSSICPNWSPDANLTNTPSTQVNATLWRGLWDPAVTLPDQAPDPNDGGYYLWWFQNMPNAGNALTFNGMPLPNWWDFVADTDEQIRQYIHNKYWMNPNLKFPSYSTTSTHGLSGTLTTWEHTGPPSSNTLGVSTAFAQTPTSSYVNMALVTASYQAVTNQSAQLTSVRYCGQQMARIGGSNGRAKYGNQTSEMWYLLNPPAGKCEVMGIFSADPGERIMSATVFHNIDSVDPIESTQRFGLSTTSNSTIFNDIRAKKSGPKDSVLMCNLSGSTDVRGARSDGFGVDPNNEIELDAINIWFRRQTNITANLVSSFQRREENQTKILEWLSGVGNTRYPWALMCANFRVKPFVTPTPPPVTAPPSPEPPTAPPTTPPPSTPTTITIFASPVGSPTMELRINDQTVASFNVNSSNSRYTYTASGYVSVDQVKVYFVNDSGSNDLFVDKITMNGNTYESEAPNTYSTGVYTNGKCQTQGGYFRKDKLSCNGYFKYSPQPQSPTPLPTSSDTVTPTPMPPTPTPTPTGTPYTGDPVYMCWNRVIEGDGGYYWPNGCGGYYFNDGRACSQAFEELAPIQVTAYLDWVEAGRPPTPCTGGPTPPPTTVNADLYSIAKGDFLTTTNIVSLQAENFDQSIPRSRHEWQLRTGTSGYTGAGYMQSLPNNTQAGNNALNQIPTTQAELNYRVYFAQSGTYYVWLRGSAPSGTDDSVHIGINGVVTNNSDQLTLVGKSSFSWRSASYDGPARPTIQVPFAGLHTINLYNREDGVKIDQLLFTKSSTYKP